MTKFNMTREEHAQAVLEAIEDSRKLIQTKEGARKFLIDAGIIKEDKAKSIIKPKIKKSK
jgi:fructose/tagatose bisphosphate aldolase